MRRLPCVRLGLAHFVNGRACPQAGHSTTARAYASSPAASGASCLAARDASKGRTGSDRSFSVCTLKDRSGSRVGASRRTGAGGSRLPSMTGPGSVEAPRKGVNTCYNFLYQGSFQGHAFGRPALDTGQLGIVVLDAPGDGPPLPGRAWTAPGLEVSAPTPVQAVIDGEAVELSPPLRFAIRPARLRVRISARDPGTSPSARFPCHAGRAVSGRTAVRRQ